MRTFRNSVTIAAVILTASLLAAQGNQTDDKTRAVPFGADLHEAARMAGGHYKTLRVNTDGPLAYVDLKALARASSEILVGTAVKNECKLSSDGRSISTHYEVRVEEKFKGRFRPGDVITVVLPGGEIGWDDGTTARISTPDFHKMINDMRYLLYLQGKPQGSEFNTTGGSQGVVLLKDDGTVVPFAHHPEQKIANLRGKTHHEVLEEARTAAQDTGENP